jgi:hypothetical protein
VGAGWGICEYGEPCEKWRGLRSGEDFQRRAQENLFPGRDEEEEGHPQTRSFN